MYVDNLRTEFLRTPLGIGAESPRLSWLLESNERCQEQTAYQILVSTSEEMLQADTGDMWDTGKVSSDQSIHIVYGGRRLESRKRYFWKVRVWDKYDNVSCYSAARWWEMGLLGESDWCAHWVSMNRDQRGVSDEKYIKPAPLLRKEFCVQKEIRRARLYVTALGLYEVYISGMRVGDDVLSPGWTDYNKRIYYQTYDVTGLVEYGKNVVGAILGEGWYSGSVAHVGAYQYGSNPALLLQLEIEYVDDTVDYIVTDGTWKCSIGPVLYSDLLMGETYDARDEIRGWSAREFDDSTWMSVDVIEGIFGGALMAQVGPTIKITQKCEPVAVWQTNNHTYVVDMGQNMVGWVRLKVRGNRGTKVTMRFAEMLDSDGNIYTANLRGAKQTDTYVLKGEGVEVFEPRFTFHGFRYVEVIGYPGRLTSCDMIGCVIHSATPEAGSFECSDSLVNQLQKNITWGQRGNFLSIPTDCPQRNERMGWTGDAQIFIRTACWNMDVAGFFTKWMVDVEDAQFESGAFTDVAPQVRNMGGGNAAWGDAGVIVPWTIYKVYGDTRIIETHYNAMTRWIDYLKMNSTKLLRPEHGYGDWLSTDADTPKDVLGTAYFAYSAKHDPVTTLAPPKNSTLTRSTPSLS
jgi:alpha-L-rhamnosidase